MKTKKALISDSWMFFYVYPLLAILVVHIGNENSFAQLISIPSYYSDLVLAICCSYLLGLYVKYLVFWMNKKYPWHQRPKSRILIQFMLGIVLPTSILLIVELVYLSLLNIKLEDSSIFYLELPLILIFCLLINLIYIALNYHQLSKGFQGQQNVHGLKSYFLVQKGKGLLNISEEDVAYFRIQNKLTFLVTCRGESYLYDFPFKEILPGLPQNEFFQLNRQVIAKRSSILKTVPTDTRRLEIELFPAIKDGVFVSKTKMTSFKNWLKSA